MDPTRTLAERIGAGRSTLVIGDLPDLPPGVVALRVGCEHAGPIGVLDRARATIEAVLDHGVPPRWPGRDRQALAAHRRLLASGEGFRRSDIAFVEACNLLAAKANGRVVLVFDGIDDADEETLRAIARVLREPARLRLPLVLLARRGTNRTTLDDDPMASTSHATPARPAQPTPTEPLPTVAFEAIGGLAPSLEQRLDAVASMIDSGETGRATATLDETKSSIEEVPSLAARRLLEARARIERARLRWLTTGEASAGTLAEAWVDALGAWHELPAKGAPGLRAYAAATLAAIAYDRGEVALDQAREILIDTIGELLQEGATVDAASLLNEQAALELRRERVAPAAEILQRSRLLFEARVKETAGEAASRAELADTDLLLARLPLHASTLDPADARFLDDEWFASAMRSAHAAEQTYRSLGMRREVARACDVIGRLEARRGHREGARARFEEAFQIAEELGDAPALARSTAALAEVLADAGQPEKALGLLRSSIYVNREKGSMLGLSFDAAALDVIETAVSRMGGAVESAMRSELANARADLDDGNGPITARLG